MEVVEEKIIQTKKRKVRVFQVAKEFNISIESILKFLKLQKYPVKNQMSLISDEMYLELSAKFGKEKAPIKTAELDYQKKLREKHQQEELRKQFINKEIEELVTSVPGPIVIEKKKVKPVKKKPVEPKEPEKKAAKKEDKRLESILASEVTTTEHYIPEKEKPKREKAPKISEGKAPGEKEKKTQPKTEAGPKVRVHMISKDEKKDKEEKAKAPGEELKKKKKKKRKERLKEEAAKRAQEKGRKRKKKEPKHKISAEEVEAAVKRTMAAMEEKSGRPKHRKKVAQNEEDSVEEAKNILRVSEFISVGELARAMDVEPNEVIRGLMSLGMLVSINQRLDMDTIIDRKSTRLNSSHIPLSRMPSSA